MGAIRAARAGVCVRAFAGLAVLCAPLVAAGEPPIDLDALGIEAYGGPHFRATTLSGRAALLGGGPISALVTQRVGVGVSWSATEGDDAEGRFLYYGGPRAELRLWPGGPVDASVGLLVGPGVLGRGSPQAGPGGALLVIEPDVVLALPVTRSLRVALGAGWRFVPVSEVGSSRALGGPVGGLSLQYGVFGPSPPRRLAAPRVQLSGFVSQKLTWLEGEPVWLDAGGTRLLLARERLAVGVTGALTRMAAQDRGRSLSMGYGGLEATWELARAGPLHVLGGAVLAMGGAGWRDNEGEHTSAVVFVEPEAIVELELATFARAAVCASYRGAACLDCEAMLGAGELAAPALAAQLRFGWFGAGSDQL